MLIDGEKWACDACVRGHRVSSCHHSDRPLTRINKKGRPVTQCTHCRGLRKSRTTHVKCECGDKKKNNSHKNDSDSDAVDMNDLKQDTRHQCGCTVGQRCTCALKREHHLDPVPESGLPPAQPPAHSDLEKPHLVSTKSESTLTIFRDGHHKPAHKHNDMAHRCGMPYTIPRSHTIHSTDAARRSADHLPLSRTTHAGEKLSQGSEQLIQVQPRLAKSEHGSPESAPVTASENLPRSVPPLDLSSFLGSFSSGPTTSLPNSSETSLEPDSMPVPYDKVSVEQIMTTIPATDASSFSFPPTTSSVPCMAVSDTYENPYFAFSTDTEFPVVSAGLSDASVDWSRLPLYASDAPVTNSTQTPSFASFDYNAYPSNLPAASSSGDVSEVEEFAAFSGVGSARNELHDMPSASETSEADHYRISSASSFTGLPQAQLLSSTNLDSINIDDFLKCANESTAVLEHQMQTSMSMELKLLPTQDGYSIQQTPAFDGYSSDLGGLPMDPSPTDADWSAAMFDADPTSIAANFYRQSWS